VAGIADKVTHAKGGDETPHWTYEGDTGASHWHSLGFPAANGKEQSPIDIISTAVKDIDLPKLDINYEDETASILNNGHTIQVNWPAGEIKIGEKEYELLQFHFHSPSEHTMDGKSYPLEMHLVHKEKNAAVLAVIAVFFQEKEGANNKFLDQFWDQLPAEIQTEGKPPKNIGELDSYDLELCLQKYYRYNGSLTTPPCSEGVIWTLLEKPDDCSPEQIAAFKKCVKENNNRPVQPLNDRVVCI